MSTKDQPSTYSPKVIAKDKGVFIELNSKSLNNLIGFFDVLIQMDLKQVKLNERSKNEKSLQSNTEDSTQSD